MRPAWLQSEADKKKAALIQLKISVQIAETH